MVRCCLRSPPLLYDRGCSCSRRERAESNFAAFGEGVTESCSVDMSEAVDRAVVGKVKLQARGNATSPTRALSCSWLGLRYAAERRLRLAKHPRDHIHLQSRAVNHQANNTFSTSKHGRNGTEHKTGAEPPPAPTLLLPPLPTSATIRHDTSSRANRTHSREHIVRRPQRSIRINDSTSPRRFHPTSPQNRPLLSMEEPQNRRLAPSPLLLTTTSRALQTGISLQRTLAHAAFGEAPGGQGAEAH